MWELLGQSLQIKSGFFKAEKQTVPGTVKIVPGTILCLQLIKRKSLTRISGEAFEIRIFNFD